MEHKEIKNTAEELNSDTLEDVNGGLKPIILDVDVTVKIDDIVKNN